MLNASYLRNDLFPCGAIQCPAWDVKGENDVGKFTPEYRPVVTIRYGKKDGKPAGRAAARVYALPDDTLIRLRLKDDNTYAYEEATLFPEDNRAVLAVMADPSRDPNESVEITLAEEGPASERIRANEADVALLKKELEARFERGRLKAKAAGLIP